MTMTETLNRFLARQPIREWHLGATGAFLAAYRTAREFSSRSLFASGALGNDVLADAGACLSADLGGCFRQHFLRDVERMICRRNAAVDRGLQKHFLYLFSRYAVRQSRAKMQA
jgi:hypothetical protein